MSGKREPGVASSGLANTMPSPPPLPSALSLPSTASRGGQRWRISVHEPPPRSRSKSLTKRYFTRTDRKFARVDRGGRPQSVRPRGRPTSRGCCLCECGHRESNPLPARSVAVRSDLTGDRAFRVGAHGETGDSQHGGLFLDTSAVGEDHPGVRDQAEEG